jgi:hypothetical protein
MSSSTETARTAPKLIKTLAGEFEALFSTEAIELCVNESLAHFESARVREFVPLLAYRITRERLLRMSQAT